MRRAAGQVRRGNYRVATDSTHPTFIVTEHPYASPSATNMLSSRQDSSHGKAFSKPVLVAFCAAIGAITWTSVSTGVPTVYAPFPFVVILPAFLGLPVPLISVFAAGIFALAHLRHFKGIPRPIPHFGFTILLTLNTALTALAIIIGWSYGLQYQGAIYTVGVASANCLFCSLAWALWRVSRRPYCYGSQVIFGFILFAWLFWYALPYMGELP